MTTRWHQPYISLNFSVSGDCTDLSANLLLGFDMSGIDALIPVPLSVRGLRERGF